MAKTHEEYQASREAAQRLLDKAQNLLPQEAAIRGVVFDYETRRVSVGYEALEQLLDDYQRLLSALVTLGALESAVTLRGHTVMLESGQQFHGASLAEGLIQAAGSIQELKPQARLEEEDGRFHVIYTTPKGVVYRSPPYSEILARNTFKVVLEEIRSGRVLDPTQDLSDWDLVRVVHVLRHSQSLCERPGVPRDWPLNHTWVSVADTELHDRVSCPVCRDRLALLKSEGP